MPQPLDQHLAGLIFYSIFVGLWKDQFAVPRLISPNQHL